MGHGSQAILTSIVQICSTSSPSFNVICSEWYRSTFDKAKDIVSQNLNSPPSETSIKPGSLRLAVYSAARTGRRNVDEVGVKYDGDGGDGKV
jgi:hypothetical protein